MEPAGSHTNEEYDILGLLLVCKRSHKPCCRRCLSGIIAQGDGVSAGLIQGHPAIDFGGDVNNRGYLCILSKEVLVPREGPFLESRLLRDFEEIGNALGLLAVLGDGGRELFIRDAVVECLGAILGSMDFKPDVKLLPRKEVLLVRRENTS